MRRLLLVLAAFAPLLSGCVNTDASVFVEAHLINPQATVTAGTLGTSLQVEALLAMHLGVRSSGGSTVTLVSFSLTNADQTMTLLSPLELASTPPQTSIAVPSDSDVDVALSFDTGADLLQMPTAAELCAGPLVITGAIQDSLQTSQTPFATATFNATCM